MLRAGRFLLLLAVLLALPTAGFAVSFTVDQCATCGPTGGQALQIITTGLTAPVTAAIALINTSASYSPSGITSINASVWKDASVSQSTAYTGTFSSGFRPAVEQDGNIYILNPAIAGPIYGSNTTASTSFTSGWGTGPISATGLTLSQFFLYSFATGAFGTSNPNGTDQVYFGLATISTFNNTQLVNATGETDFANLNISDGPLLVDNTFSDLSNYQVLEFTSTPEPSTLLLLGSGLAGLYCRRRKRTV